jgi:5-methylcytosine-specific restriction endonuclease McrA
MLSRAGKELASWLVEIEDRKIYRHFACSSVYHYGALHLGLAGHTVAENLRTARRLSGLPLLAAAYEQGALSATHIRELTRVATPGTERSWLEAAEGRTTREIEKMVAFTQAGAPPPGHGRGPGESYALPGENHCAGEPGSIPAGAPVGPGGCPPGEEAEGSRSPALPESAHPPALPERPRPSREKFLLELEAGEMALLAAALKKARKETGRYDRSALILHMARAFLETPPGREIGSSNGAGASSRHEGEGPSSSRAHGRGGGSPYRVVLHHHLPSGLSWCATVKGERPLTPEAIEKALCDAEIVIADEEPGPWAPVEEHQGRCPSSMKEGERLVNSPVETRRACDPAGAPQGEAKERALDHIRELYTCMKSAGARRGGKGAQEIQGGSRVEERRRRVRARRSLSPSLRAKVLERDGHRCQVPGCGRGYFLVVHHLDPVALGGKDDPDRLVTLCPGCHDLVHQHLLRVERDDAGRLRWAPLPGKPAAEAHSRL